MKISKRGLGVVLALIMIFNVLTVGTFAAYDGTAAAKLLITTDKATYAPGDEVVISFGVHSKEEAGNFSASGQWAYGYDSSVLEFVEKSDYNLGTAGDKHGFVLDASQTGFVGAMSQIVPSVTGEDIASGYGWDTIGGVCIGGTGGFVDTISSEFMFFSFKMKIKEDAADGTYTIGFNAPCYETWWAYNSSDVAGEGNYGDNGGGTDFDFGTATFTVSSAPAVEVYHSGTQARYAYPGTPSAAAYQFGFLGGVSGLTPETVAQDGHNVVTNIQSIVATAEYNGTIVTSEVVTMWAEGEDYGFRAVFADFDYLDTKDIVVTFAITMDDGTTVYKTPDTATDTANGIYTAAVGRGMPAIA